MLKIAEGDDGETVRMEGAAQILELGGEEDEEEEDALATSAFEAMREEGGAQAGQRSLYHDMYLQHQQQQQQLKQHQQQLQQHEQQQQETSDKAVSANLLRPDAAGKFHQMAVTTAANATSTTDAGHTTIELVTQASTESAFDSEEKNVQTDWSTIGKVGELVRKAVGTGGALGPRHYIFFVEG